jgi:hypothetical protein
MGLRKAINDKCRDCIYDRFSPGKWREQVQLCTVTRCPLYPVRPMSKVRKTADLATFNEGVGSAG